MTPRPRSLASLGRTMLEGSGQYARGQQNRARSLVAAAILGASRAGRERLRLVGAGYHRATHCTGVDQRRAARGRWLDLGLVALEATGVQVVGAHQPIGDAAA